MGRPDCSGASQAKATIWHSWSAVIRGGAPGLGKSSSRSLTFNSVKGSARKSSHRCRHRRTIPIDMFCLRAISALVQPALASRMIRPRSAICWSVLCAFNNCSSSCRSDWLNSIMGGFGPGMNIIPIYPYRLPLSYTTLSRVLTTTCNHLAISALVY